MLNWKTIGQEREWPKPCCCVFVAPGKEMDNKDCPVHPSGIYTCCGSDAMSPCTQRCTQYRPRSYTPTLRLECIGEPAFATRWAPCVCGHPAQYHG
jgi:hypothetical protein